MVNKKAIKLINNKEYEQANKISFILFQKKNIDEFLEINNLLLEENYIPALPLRGYYHLIEDTTVDILSHTYQMHSTSNNIKREK